MNLEWNEQDTVDLIQNHAFPRSIYSSINVDKDVDFRAVLNYSNSYLDVYL